MRAQTTHHYATAFMNLMRDRTADAIDIRERPRVGNALALPTELENMLRQEIANWNIFRTISTVRTLDTVSAKIKALVPFGDATFVAETGTIPEEDLESTSLNVACYKIARLIKLTYEFANDAGFDLEGALVSEFGRSFGRCEEQACISGTGSGEPYGILHASQGAEVGVTAASATAITLDEVRELYFSVDPQFRRNGVWIMNDETAYNLRTKKDTSGYYLWRDNDDTILSKPVYISPFMHSLEAGAKPIAFGDFRYFWLLERGYAAILPLFEKYAITGHVGFIGSERIEARLTRPDAVKVLQLNNA